MAYWEVRIGGGHTHRLKIVNQLDQEHKQAPQMSMRGHAFMMRQRAGLRGMISIGMTTDVQRPAAKQVVAGECSEGMCMK